MLRTTLCVSLPGMTFDLVGLTADFFRFKTTTTTTMIAAMTTAAAMILAATTIVPLSSELVVAEFRADWLLDVVVLSNTGFSEVEGCVVLRNSVVDEDVVVDADAKGGVEEDAIGAFGFPVLNTILWSLTIPELTVDTDVVVV